MNLSMRLINATQAAEAIRLGSKDTLQGFGHNRIEIGEQTYTCAMGAMMRGLKPESNERFLFRFSLTGCPACDSRESNNFLIIHLNDDHRWAREKIADWIEQST